MKRIVAFILLLTFSTFGMMMGCDFFDEPIPEGTGAVKIVTEVPSKLLDLSGLDSIVVKEIDFSVSRGEEIYTQTEEIDGTGEVEVVFDELDAGDWDLAVNAVDEEGYVVYLGNEKARVEADAVAEVTVDMLPNTGILDLKVEFSEQEGVRGKLYLSDPSSEEDKVYDLDVNGNEASVRVEDLASRTWEAGIELKDGDGEVIWEKENIFLLEIFPGRVNEVTLEIFFGTGDININLNWSLPPDAPWGLEAQYEESGILLNWEQDNLHEVMGFRVFRSESEDGIKTALNSELITETSFHDGDFKTGVEYFYWILMYSEDGYASRLSDPISFKVQIEEGIWGNVFLKHEFPVPDFESGFSSSKHNSPVREIDFNISETEEETVPGELIVAYDDLTTMSSAMADLRTRGLSVLDKNSVQNVFLVGVPEGEENIVTSELMEVSGVRYVEPNYKVNAHGTIPRDDLYEHQWHYPLIRLPQAWSVTTGSSSVRIAVLDTGCDATHPDLAQRLDVDNGYNFIEGNQDTQDYNMHGTHVAGTIGAVTNNDLGVAGVMWDGEILPVKVLDDSGAGDYWSVGQGMLYAAGLLEDDEIPENPAPVDVINMSLGGGGTSEYFTEVVERVHSAGVIMVGSAGNSGGPSIGYPAAYPEVISVGAVDYNYPNEPQLTHYSSYGPEMDLVAPGGDINNDTDGDGYMDGVLSTVLDEEYGLAQGTSMSAPHVSGVIGLMLSEGISSNMVREILKDTSMILGQDSFEGEYFAEPPENGEDGEIVLRLINAYWAVSEVKEIKVMVGERDGNTINAVAETSIGIGEREFAIGNIPEGNYRLFAWVDVQDNGIIEPGDYFSESEKLEFRPGELLNIDLIAQEKRE